MNYKWVTIWTLMIVILLNFAAALNCHAELGEKIENACDTDCNECYCYIEKKIPDLDENLICLAVPSQANIQWFNVDSLHTFDKCEVNTLPGKIQGCNCGGNACNYGGAYQYCCDTNNDSMGEICSKDPCSRSNIFKAGEEFILGKGFCENKITVEGLNRDWKATLKINEEVKTIDFDSGNDVASQGSLVYLNIDSVNYPIRISNSQQFITLFEEEWPCYNQCKTNFDCEDNNPCTVDECVESPKKCSHDAKEGRWEDGKYCDKEGDLRVQKEDNSICSNNYECVTNICKKELCVNPNWFRNIMNWMRRVWG